MDVTTDYSRGSESNLCKPIYKQKILYITAMVFLIKEVYTEINI